MYVFYEKCFVRNDEINKLQRPLENVNNLIFIIDICNTWICWPFA